MKKEIRSFNLDKDWNKHTRAAKLLLSPLKTHMRVVMPNHDMTILECQTDVYYESDLVALSKMNIPIRITANKVVS